MVDRKQSELYKYYTKKIWQEIVQFVSIPKVILTVCLYFLIFNFLKNFQTWSEVILYSLLLLISIYGIVDSLRLTNQIKKQQKKYQKKWLIQSVVSQVYALPPAICFGPIYIRYFFEGGNNAVSLANPYMHFLTAFCLFHFIAIYVLIFKIKPALKNEIVKTENKFRLAY